MQNPESKINPAAIPSLDVAGRRADLASRPELRCGTVDYDVTHLPDYCTRTPQPARLLVMLKICRTAV